MEKHIRTRLHTVAIMAAILMTLPGCVIHRVSLDELSQDIAHDQQEHNLGLLWYMGSEDGYHYLKFVYGMFEETRYSVSEDELPIENTFPYSSDWEDWEVLKEHHDPWPLPFPLKRRGK